MQLYDKRPAYGNPAEPIEEPRLSPALQVDAILGAARRQWLVVFLCGILGIAVGLAYLMTAVPLYRSQISILIDRSNSDVVQQFSNMNSVLDDEATVLSQVEILKSDSIALAVVDKLKLFDDPNFVSSQGSVASLIATWLGMTSQEDDAERRRLEAAAQLQQNVEVSRSGRTYVMDLTYVSPSKELAAKIANTYGDIYILDKLNSKYEAIRRASGWLQERIAELRQRALESDLAVQRFRSANNLISTGTGVISDQQLKDLNTSLSAARSNIAEVSAKYGRIQQIINSGQMDAVVSDALGNAVIDDLRKKYLTASKTEADISRRLGEGHVQAVRLRDEMQEYQRLMFEELQRIAQSYQSELEVAQAREKNLVDSVNEATGVSSAAGEAQVQLRELEREADNYRNLYQRFLQRYQEASQQQSFPITEARVITRAVPAEKAAFPRRGLMLALFCLLGCAVGGGIGAFREFRDRYFRMGDQIRSVLGLEFLGSIPFVAANKAGPGKQAPPVRAPGGLSKLSSIYNYVVDRPLSHFTETLRSAKIAADFAISGDSKIIGIVSTLPGEGKTTVAINFAELLASQGKRTVLIDADLRNPGATKSIAYSAEAGLLEVLMEDRRVEDVLLHNPQTKLAFLPAVITRRIPHSSELLGSVAMRQILSELSGHYDYIIVDLPPLGAVVDARAIAPRIDGFVLVAEWGRTARRVVRQTIEGEPRVQEKCLGVILNKVDQEKMKLYNAFGSQEYYHSHYLEYYRE